jgi:hypothetical protein
MTCLSIIQDVSQELGGFAMPINAAVTSSDPQVLQLLALLNKEGKELAKRPEQGWQALNFDASFLTVATSIQGSINTIAPNYRYILNDTIYNTTRRWPVFGSMSPQEWARQKALFALVPYNQYRVVGGNICFIPNPTAGDTCTFQYQGKNWATDGSNTFDRFTADTQTGLLDEDLLALGVKWRWKAEKGLDYAEDFATYERQVSVSIARDIPRSKLSLDRKRLVSAQFPWVQSGDFPSN